MQAAFSLAYLSLNAGIGALILFGAVQATMIGVGLWTGERSQPHQWLGYRAHQGLTTTRTAILQLLVLILATLGGVIFLAEQVSMRLAVACVAILGGVAMVVLRSASAPEPVTDPAHR